MMSRHIEPFLFDCVYLDDFPVISNTIDILNNDLEFTRFGSLKPGYTHFFVDDWRLESVWRDPLYMLDRAFNSRIVTAPDFSIFPDYPFPLSLYQVWRSRYVAYWWQINGVQVVPVLQWTHSKDPNLTRYFDGLKNCAVVAVRSPTRTAVDDWLKCIDFFQSLNPKTHILHFGLKRQIKYANNHTFLKLNKKLKTLHV